MPDIDWSRTDLGERARWPQPLRLAVDGTVLSFLSATLMFGAPQDVTLSELAVEIFLPADAATAEALRARALAKP